MRRLNISCAVLLLCIATATTAHTQIFSSVFSFDGSDGVAPFSPLTQGADGESTELPLKVGTTTAILNNPGAARSLASRRKVK